MTANRTRRAGGGRGTTPSAALDRRKPMSTSPVLVIARDVVVGALLASMAELAGFSIGVKKSPFVGGIVISTGPDEFIAIGKDFSLAFTPQQNDDSILDIEYLEEGKFVNDKWVTIRRLNGDEGTGGGDYGFGFGNPRVATLRFPASANGDYNIVRMKIYRYK